MKESQPPDKEIESRDGESPKGYYYDDSTGYEKYEEEADQDEEEVCADELPEIEG